MSDIFADIIIVVAVAGMLFAVWASWHMHKDSKHEERMFNFRCWARGQEYVGPDTLRRRKGVWKDKQL